MPNSGLSQSWNIFHQFSVGGHLPCPYGNGLFGVVQGHSQEQLGHFVLGAVPEELEGAVCLSWGATSPARWPLAAMRASSVEGEVDWNRLQGTEVPLE